MRSQGPCRRPGRRRRRPGRLSNDAFDYVILSQTLQATRQPRLVLEHMLRIGRHGIVSFPNFGHWRIRLQIFFGGHMPHTDNLPYAWYETPNIHFCSIKDFRELCRVAGAKMEQAVALNAWGGRMRLKMPWWFWNLFGEQAVFLLSRGKIYNDLKSLSSLEGVVASQKSV